MTRMKILVTGGTGFIGQHLIQALAAEGYPLKILVRSPEKAAKVSPWGEPVVGNLRQAESLENAVKDVLGVVHGAGVIRGNSLQDFREGNVQTAQNLAQACLKTGAAIQRFIHLSSLSGFGPSPTEALPVEDAAPAPVSDYGLSKLEAEQVLDSLLPQIHPIHLRLSAVYGPGDRETFSFFKMGRYHTVFVPGDGEQKIQMLFVSDAVRSVQAALKADAGGPVFIAHPRILSFSDLILAIGNAMGKRFTVIPVHSSMVRGLAWANLRLGRLFRWKTMFNPQKAREILSRRWICSTEKARNMLKFDCIMDFPEGARESYRWYKENRWL